MIKNIVVALTTSALLLGVAAPAMAAPAPTPEAESSFDDDYVLTLLAEKGIDASSVEEWGSSYLVAWVANDQGGQTMIYLDPDTLDVVTP